MINVYEGMRKAILKDYELTDAYALYDTEAFKAQPFVISLIGDNNAYRSSEFIRITRFATLLVLRLRDRGLV